MSGILVPCRRCGRQVDSSEVREGLCLTCRVDSSVADLLTEHARLWRKRERYQGRGANVESIARQLEKVERRMAERIVALVPEQKPASEHMERILAQAKQQRYDLRSFR
jgi:hypothetical protein